MPTRAKRMPKRTKPRQRESATRRGYGYRWQQFARRWLRSNPLCAECHRRDRIRPATCVDHIRPHRGDMQVFWQVGNHQSLCSECHTAKTMAGL